MRYIRRHQHKLTRRGSNSTRDVSDSRNTSHRHLPVDSRRGEEEPTTVPFVLHSHLHLPLQHSSSNSLTTHPRTKIFWFTHVPNPPCLDLTEHRTSPSPPCLHLRTPHEHSRRNHLSLISSSSHLLFPRYDCRRTRPPAGQSTIRDEPLPEALVQRRSTVLNEHFSQRRWAISLNETAAKPKVQHRRSHLRHSLCLTRIRPPKLSTGRDRSPSYPVFPATPDATT